MVWHLAAALRPAPRRHGLLRLRVPRPPYPTPRSGVTSPEDSHGGSDPGAVGSRGVARHRRRQRPVRLSGGLSSPVSWRSSPPGRSGIRRATLSAESARPPSGLSTTRMRVHNKLFSSGQKSVLVLCMKIIPLWLFLMLGVINYRLIFLVWIWIIYQCKVLGCFLTFFSHQYEVWILLKNSDRYDSHY